MSSSEIISFDASKDVRFGDMKALNNDLMNLLEFDSYTEGEPVMSFKDGKIKIRCGEDDSLSGQAQTYGCWNEAGSRLLAKHLKEGRILLRVSPEGWPDELHLITPGTFQAVDVGKLLGF